MVWPRWLLASWFALGVAAGCTRPLPRECTTDDDCVGDEVCRGAECIAACTTDDDCEGDEACIDRACVPAGADAGDDATTDARADASPDVPTDAPPCSDRDDDGACDDVDCAPGDPRIRPGGIEVCTPHGEAPIDETCDGRLDEGCPYTFSPGGPIIAIQVDGSSAYLPRLSADRLRLCFADGVARCAVRATVTAPFTAPILVGVPGTVLGLELSPDGREAYVETTSSDGSGLHLSVLDSDGAWSAPTLVAASHFHPSMSTNGLELFAQHRPGGGMPNRIVRATRTATTEPFGAFSPVDLGSGGASEGAPFVAEDGSLFFTRVVGTTITNHVATRPAGAEVFDPAVALPALDTTASQLAYYRSTGELFYVSAGSWSTGSFTIFRARACREVACAVTPIDCDAGVRSPDGAHCYVDRSAAVGARQRSAAVTECGTDGSHLVTLHSDGEARLAMGTISTDDRWTGGRRPIVGGTAPRWDTGEPFVYAPWGVGEPSTGSGISYTTTSGAPVMRTSSPDAVLDFTCETETWLTW